MTAHSAILSNGTTSVDLADGVNYRLTQGGWAPGVSRLGPDGRYLKMVESVTFDTFSTSTSDSAYAALAQVIYLLDWANRYAAGEDLAPVTFNYKLINSALTGGVSFLVLGAGDVESLAKLSPSFNDMLGVWEVPATTILLQRKGLLSGATETVAFGAGLANPGIISKTFAGGRWETQCPLSLKVGGFDAGVGFPAGMLIVTGASLQKFEAEGAALGKFTSVADTVKFASGGSVLRYTATDTAETLSATFTLPTAIRGRAHVYAALRNTSGHQWQIRIIAYPQSGLSTSVATIPFSMDAGENTSPTIIPLGMIAMNRAMTFKAFSIAATCLAFSGTPQLDIDYLIVAQDSPDLFVVQHGGAVFTGFPVATPAQIRINANMLTADVPSLTVYEDYLFTESALNAFSRYDIATPSDVVRVAWLAPTGTNWVNTLAGAATVTPIEVTRRLAYLAPR